MVDVRDAAGAGQAIGTRRPNPQRAAPDAHDSGVGRPEGQEPSRASRGPPRRFVVSRKMNGGSNEGRIAARRENAVVLAGIGLPPVARRGGIGSPAGERRVAEREGFEPSVEFPLHTLSKRAPSASRSSLRSTPAFALLATARQAATLAHGKPRRGQGTIVSSRPAARGERPAAGDWWPSRGAGADRAGTKDDCEVRRTGGRRAEPGHDCRLVGRLTSRQPAAVSR